MSIMKEDPGRQYLGNDNENDETDKILLLASQKLNKKSIQVMDICYSMKV